MKLSWLTIPAEMRQYPQWAVATLEPNKEGKAPRNPHTGYLIDPTASGWTFEEVVNSGYPAIGFLLGDTDPFTIIDLDYKSDLAPDIVRMRDHVYHSFAGETYSELSQSGLGCHIIAKGRIGGGRRRPGIEIYDRDRFIICTGNTLPPAKPIMPAQEALEALVADLGGIVSSAVEPLPEGPEIETDGELLARACNARNGEKFKRLFYTKPGPGDDWSALDASLAQMLTFYTRSSAQALRLFRQSALYRPNDKGKNPQHYESYYLHRTFSKAYKHVTTERVEHAANLQHGEELAKKALAKMNGKHHPAVDTLGPNPPKQAVGVDMFPAGLIGDIARFIYGAAHRPVAEIALAGALTMFAGIVGRQFNVSGSGLNLYTVLVAHTGRGKEGASSGIDQLMSACRAKVPSIEDFRGPGHIASGQALIKRLAERPVMFSVFPEFGHLLGVLTDERASASDMRTRLVLLDLFSKSGEGKQLQSMIYADSEKNTKVILSPTFSFLGDTTPEKFYSILNSSTVQEGLFPRFLTITYDGARVPANEGRVPFPHPDLVDGICSMVVGVLNMQHNNVFYHIPIAHAAQALLNDFDRECDAHINANGQDAELWNRAHLKALRLAALVAVGRNFMSPEISREDAAWAKWLVTRELTGVAKRIEVGDVGSGETRQHPAVVDAIRDYLKMPTERKRATYKVPHAMLEKPIIPYTFFRRRLKHQATFANDRRGTVAAIKAALADAVEMGILQPLSTEQKFELDKGLRPDTQVFAIGEHFEP